MTRDEILDAIQEESTVRGAFIPSLADIRSRMRRVAALADQYSDEEEQQYLAESMSDAMSRFSAMIALHL